MEADDFVKYTRYFLGLPPLICTIDTAFDNKSGVTLAVCPCNDNPRDPDKKLHDAQFNHAAECRFGRRRRPTAHAFFGPVIKQFAQKIGVEYSTPTSAAILKNKLSDDQLRLFLPKNPTTQSAAELGSLLRF